MAAATSPATGRTYGVRRVCAIWGVARSSFYDARRQEERPPQSPAGRQGPKPRLSDEDLLAAIRRDLARSPWTGEGHRKVWVTLRPDPGPVRCSIMPLEPWSCRSLPALGFGVRCSNGG